MKFRGENNYLWVAQRCNETKSKEIKIMADKSYFNFWFA
jgi:hypothetical protein